MTPQYQFIIPADPAAGMRVPGRIFASQEIFNAASADGSLTQVKNAATLPGIVDASIAMPDIHFGYGLPIGGVVATDVKTGVITPGGVGYDINCGVRLLSLNLSQDDIQSRIPDILKDLFRSVPCGVGEGGDIRLKEKELRSLLKKGAAWAVEAGYGRESDLLLTESHGSLTFAEPASVSERALERGYDQLGTLGSGNHFLEIGVVDEIYNEETASAWNLQKGQITVMIHSGSRGLGHQVCADYLALFEKALKKYNISVPDIQLACAPVRSPEAEQYLGAMAAAANYAWANRQVLAHRAIRSIMATLGTSGSSLRAQMVYDLAHNIVKMEKHTVSGKEMLLAVHRKGATRAFPPGHMELPEIYRPTGQPVIVPGDMGRYSYLLAGTATGAKLSFSSCCHGAGRMLSRHAAIKASANRDIPAELAREGVAVMGRTKNSLKEEMPDAYKDVADVVDVVHHAGIAEKVLRLKPLAVMKG